jgi:hypothetical protein
MAPALYRGTTGQPGAAPLGVFQQPRLVRALHRVGGTGGGGTLRRRRRGPEQRLAVGRPLGPRPTRLVRPLVSPLPAGPRGRAAGLGPLGTGPIARGAARFAAAR